MNRESGVGRAGKKEEVGEGGVGGGGRGSGRWGKGSGEGVDCGWEVREDGCRK